MRHIKRDCDEFRRVFPVSQVLVTGKIPLIINRYYRRSLSQAVSGCRRTQSNHELLDGPLMGTENPRVGGSNPPLGTIFLNKNSILTQGTA
jgi:hypothetical protein